MMEIRNPDKPHSGNIMVEKLKVREIQISRIAAILW
jgi:hypothetical protein